MLGRVEGVAASRRPISDVTVRVPEAGPATPARLQYRSLYRRVAVTDALAVAAGLIVAHWIRYGIGAPRGNFLWLFLWSPLITCVVYGAFRLYQAHRFTPAEEFRRIILAVTLSLIGVVTLSLWSMASLSRLWLALSWILGVFFALASRRVWHWSIFRSRMKGRYLFPTLIVGTNVEAMHLETAMQHPRFGYRSIGLVATDESAPARGASVMGGIGDLRDLIRETGAECVFVAASALSSAEIAHVAKAVRREGVEVRVTATLPEMLASRLTVQPIGGMMALSLKPVSLSGTQAAVKRAFDLSASSLGLLLLSPGLLLIAAAVKLTSSGPVFYRQGRVGQRGAPFTMLKFRTMRDGADANVAELRRTHGIDGLMFKLQDDPRVTRLGRMLRRFSLDELPQLINVLRGEMSLVGPRPPLPEEVAEYEDWQFDRLEVPPGVTGLWQVSGRSELSFDECVRLDLFYIENWSLAYDLYIVAKTLPALVSRRGAY
ncbi:MAG: sugar transferase [Actinomycetota bacterium]|nr:sugar transferase [Actinomycetota bacterium]